MTRTALALALTLAIAPTTAVAEPVATYYGHGQIGDGGAPIDTSIAIEKHDATIHIHMHAEVHNYLLVQDVNPSVIVSLVAKDGSVYTQARVDIPNAPGRGWPWSGPVARGADLDLDLAIDPSATQGLSEVRWQFYERAPGNPLQSLASQAIEIVVPLLLAQ